MGFPSKQAKECISQSCRVVIGVGVGAAVSLALSVRTMAAGPGPSPLPSPDPMDIERTVRRLEDFKFFKDASCAQFANYILSQNHLPAIGRDGPPPPGLRDPLDRRGEGLSPPMLRDGYVVDTRPARSAQINTGMDENQHWFLRLDRVFEGAGSRRVKLRSVFRFRLSSRGNRQSCELLSIDFVSEAFNIHQTMGARECLDLAVRGSEGSAAAADPDQQEALSLIRKDCVSGLHYFLSLKSKATDSVRKHPGLR